MSHEPGHELLSIWEREHDYAMAELVVLQALLDRWGVRAVDGQGNRISMTCRLAWLLLQRFRPKFVSRGDTEATY